MRLSVVRRRGDVIRAQMDESNVTLSLPIVTIGERAMKSLRDGQRLRVLQTFENACNLVSESGDLISVVRQAIGAGPHNLVAAGLETAPDFRIVNRRSAGIFTIRERHILQLGLFRLDWSSAECWEAKLPVDSLAREGKIQLWRVGGQALELGPNVTDLMPLVSGKEPVSPVAVAAAGGWRQLSAGLRHGDLTACRAGAADLAGLGNGLTPACDDFMIGLMYSVWATQPGDLARAMCRAMATSARSRTNTLAAAWLCSAAKGEGSEHWVGLFRAAAAGELSIAHFAPLLSVGASSGADTVAGFVVGLRLLLGLA